MSVHLEVVPVTTTGADGSATGSAKSKAINGRVLQVRLDYAATAPATTDVTVARIDSVSVLAVADNATDGLYTPRVACTTNDGSTAITNSYDTYPVTGPLTVSVAQANALAPCVTAYIWWED